MLVKTIKCHEVNATVEIYDDFAQPYTAEGQKKIEDNCARIILHNYAKKTAEKNTA